MRARREMEEQGGAVAVKATNLTALDQTQPKEMQAEERDRVKDASDTQRGRRNRVLIAA